MTDTTGATGTQADPGTQPPAGTATTQADGAEGGQGQPESISLEEAKKLRSEAASLRRRLKDLEEKAEADAQAKLSEQEQALAKARKDGAAEVAGKADAKVRRAEVRRALSAAGCTDIELASIAPDFAELTVNEDGDVDGLDKAIEAFRGAHASLFGSPRSGTADGGVRGRPSLTVDQIRQMKPDEINARWDEVQSALAAGRR